MFFRGTQPLNCFLNIAMLCMIFAHLRQIVPFAT
ncbi:MAG: DUF1145 domain-containing protein [Chloroflexi bacterium]|nr:DUF1145 domain-containing protein [Chloroflexota bacterium]